MKTFKLTLFLLISCLISTSCNKDEDDHTTPILEAFRKDFPNAENVSWSKKNGYEIASFTLPATTKNASTKQNKAWYSENNAKCSFSKIELSFEQLEAEAPAVAAAWNASLYKQNGYAIDDIKRKEYKNDTEATYKIEAELGDTEYELIYKIDGTLISEKLDIDSDDEDDEDEPAPLQILEFISNNLPDAIITEYEYETLNNVIFHEVDFLYTDKSITAEYTMIFNDKYSLSYIAEEIDEDDYQNIEIVPSAVYNVIVSLSENKELDEICKIYMTIEDFKGQNNFKFLAVIESEDNNGDEIEEVFILDSDGKIENI